MAQAQEDEPQQDKPDLNVYQPDQDSDDIEIDRRIRRANERLKRMTMVGFPQINDTLGCQDTLTVEGGFGTGWAINYIDCGEQAAREGGGGEPTGACCLDGACTQMTEAACLAIGGSWSSGLSCDPNPCCDNCPDSMAPTITVTFTGVSLCSPITGDVNGSFVIDWVSPGHWLGTGNLITLDGVDYGTQVEVICDGGSMVVSMYSIDLGLGGIFAVINVCPPGPSSSIYTDCAPPSVIGTGGTAFISV